MRVSEQPVHLVEVAWDSLSPLRSAWLNELANIQDIQATWGAHFRILCLCWYYSSAEHTELTFIACGEVPRQSWSKFNAWYVLGTWVNEGGLGSAGLCVTDQVIGENSVIGTVDAWISSQMRKPGFKSVSMPLVLKNNAWVRRFNGGEMD